MYPPSLVLTKMVAFCERILLTRVSEEVARSHVKAKGTNAWKTAHPKGEFMGCYSYPQVHLGTGGS